MRRSDDATGSRSAANSDAATGSGVTSGVPSGFAVECRTTAAGPGDLAFIDGLRRRHSKALGFLSTVALAEKVRLGQVRLAVAGGDGRPVGFLLHGSLRKPEVRVFQLAVDPASRGMGVGRRLVADLVERSAAAGAAGVSLRCREELAANRFWHGVGFDLHDLEPARKGALFVWVRRVDGGKGGPRDDATTRSRRGAAPAVRVGRSHAATNEPKFAPRLILPNRPIDGSRPVLRNRPIAPSRAAAATNGPNAGTTSPVPNEPDFALRPILRNQPIVPGPDADSLPDRAGDSFRFHSRWHACPGCGCLTCDTWEPGAVRRRACPRCAAIGEVRDGGVGTGPEPNEPTTVAARATIKRPRPPIGPASVRTSAGASQFRAGGPVAKGQARPGKPRASRAVGSRGAMGAEDGCRKDAHRNDGHHEGARQPVRATDPRDGRARGRRAGPSRRVPTMPATCPTAPTTTTVSMAKTVPAKAARF